MLDYSKMLSAPLINASPFTSPSQLIITLCAAVLGGSALGQVCYGRTHLPPRCLTLDRVCGWPEGTRPDSMLDRPSQAALLREHTPRHMACPAQFLFFVFPLVT